MESKKCSFNSQQNKKKQRQFKTGSKSRKEYQIIDKP